LVNVNADLGRNLDIVNIMRRLAAFSYAFKFLMDPSLTRVIAERTEQLPLIERGLMNTKDLHFGKFGMYGA